MFTSVPSSSPCAHICRTLRSPLSHLCVHLCLIFMFTSVPSSTLCAHTCPTIFFTSLPPLCSPLSHLYVHLCPFFFYLCSLLAHIMFTSVPLVVRLCPIICCLYWHLFFLYDCVCLFLFGLCADCCPFMYMFALSGLWASLRPFTWSLCLPQNYHLVFVLSSVLPLCSPLFRHLLLRSCTAALCVHTCLVISFSCFIICSLCSLVSVVCWYAYFHVISFKCIYTCLTAYYLLGSTHSYHAFELILKKQILTNV